MSEINEVKNKSNSLIVLKFTNNGRRPLIFCGVLCIVHTVPSRWSDAPYSDMAVAAPSGDEMVRAPAGRRPLYTGNSVWRLLMGQFGVG
jgi:hypothetical protein